MKFFTQSVLIVIAGFLITGCATSPEYKAWKEARNQSVAAMKRLQAQYDYECSKEAVELYPVAMTTSSRTVKDAGKLVYGGSGKFTGSCSSSAFGGYNCSAREKNKSSTKKVKVES